MQETMKVGVIGCGNISGAYFKAAKVFRQMQYTHCADMNPAAAEKAAGEYGCKAVSIEELLSNQEIETVLNLTTPQAHAAINMAALKAGKHVYLEKPFALSMEEARPVMELARSRNLRVGCAPDTFLGGGIQTCRKLIDDGWIGTPISGTAFMQCPGHESWHPNPAFYYQTGGGPLFDMGPYYITALVNLLGPVKQVAAMGSRGFAERICSSDTRMGERLPVDVNTHIAGILEFHNGSVINMIMSFDVARSNCQLIELHGTSGSLSVPDPNTFGGPVKFARARKEFETVGIPFIYTDNMRSIGLADMVRGIRKGRPHRANGQLALHVLDVMCSLEQSAINKQFITLESCCDRPAALPLGLVQGELD